MNLTDQQRAIVESDAPHRVVIAGAGTGKTATIVAALAHDLTTGRVTATDAMCLTFSRSAAHELLKRFRDAHPDTRAHPYIGTTHGLALDFLDHVHEIAGQPKVVMVTEKDLRDVASAAIRELPRVSGVTPSEIVDAMKGGGTDYPRIARICADVHRRLTSQGCVPSFSIFMRAMGAATDYPRLWNAWADRAGLLVVDEAQDLSHEEVEFLRLLEPERTLVVGDPRQAIFTFRGATGGMPHLAPVGEASTVFDLSHSFRCADAIAHASHAFDDMGREGLRGSGEIGLVRTATFPREAQRILLSRWKALSLAILFRTRREADEFLGELGDYCGPFASQPPANPTLGTKLARMLMRWVANPNDPLVNHVRVRRVLGDRVDAMLAEASIPVAESVAEELIGALRESPDLAPFELSEAIKYLGRVKLASAKAGVMFVSDWLADEALDRLDDLDPELPYVGTIHSAKGREWDEVMVMMDAGFPHHRCSLAEERRLAYVAVTRARSTLTLMSRTEESRSAFVAAAMRSASLSPRDALQE